MRALFWFTTCASISHSCQILTGGSPRGVLGREPRNAELRPRAANCVAAGVRLQNRRNGPDPVLKVGVPRRRPFLSEHATGTDALRPVYVSAGKEHHTQSTEIIERPFYCHQCFPQDALTIV